MEDAIPVFDTLVISEPAENYSINYRIIHWGYFYYVHKFHYFSLIQTQVDSTTSTNALIRYRTIKKGTYWKQTVFILLFKIKQSEIIYFKQGCSLF